MRKTTGIFDRVFGVDRTVRLAPSFHPAYLLGFLLLLLPITGLAQSGVNSGASWSQYKSQCGILASTAYNDWDGTCPNSKAGGNGSTPSVPALNPQQQLGMQLGMMGANMVGQAIGQGLHDWLFGSPVPPPVTASPDPAEEQRQLAAQQLNNSGLYLLKQKNYAGAINEFQKALATNPNDSNALHNLALAKQQQKDAAVAEQTSGALGQFLGSAPANTGLFGFAQLSDSKVPNPDASTLSLVNLDSDPNVVDLRGTTKSSIDPESLKGQIDEVLAAHAQTPTSPDSRVIPPQDKDMELLSTLSQSVSSPSQVVPQQDKDMELLSTLSQPGSSQSQVVLPRDKDMELLGFPPPSGGSNPNNGQAGLPATADNAGNHSRLNPVQASTPGQTTPAYDPSLKDAPNDGKNQAGKGTGTGLFGTPVAQPTLAPADQKAGLVGTDTNANHQVNALARSEELLATNPGSNEAKSTTAGLGFDTGNKGVGAVNVQTIQTPPSAPADIQIPPSLANNKQLLAQMHMLNVFKQQAIDARIAAAAARTHLEAAQKQGVPSDQLSLLQGKANQEESNAKSLDDMVTFQTGEVRNTIKFATFNTGGNSNSAPQIEVPPPAPKTAAPQNN